MRFGRSPQPFQQQRSDTLKDFTAARAAQCGVAEPTANDFFIQGFGRSSRHRRIRSKKAFCHLVYCFKTPLNVLFQLDRIHVHHSGKSIEIRIRSWETMGLSVLHHLQPVLDRTVGHIVVFKGRCSVRLNPALSGENTQTINCTTTSQLRIATSCNELTGLSEKLDFPNTAPTQFHVVSGQGDRPT